MKATVILFRDGSESCRNTYDLTQEQELFSYTLAKLSTERANFIVQHDDQPTISARAPEFKIGEAVTVRGHSHPAREVKSVRGTLVYNYMVTTSLPDAHITFREFDLAKPASWHKP